MLQAAVFGELLAVIGDFLGIAGAVGDSRDLLEIVEHCLGLQVAENFTHGFASFPGICRGPAHGGAALGWHSQPSLRRPCGAPERRAKARRRLRRNWSPAPVTPLLYTISPARANPRPAFSLTKCPNQAPGLWQFYKKCVGKAGFHLQALVPVLQ